jgi:hypothetical protein
MQGANSAPIAISAPRPYLAEDAPVAQLDSASVFGHKSAISLVVKKRQVARKNKS